MKYPLIEAMGLKFKKFYGGDTYYIDADDVEKALQDAEVWYGEPEHNSWSTANIKYHATHSARLVCIQPIKNKTKAEAAIELLEQLNQNQALTISCFQTAIKKILEMPE